MKNLGSDAYSEFWRSIQGQQDSVARVMEEAMAASRRQADLIDANAYLLTERLRASSASFAEAIDYWTLARDAHHSAFAPGVADLARQIEEDFSSRSSASNHLLEALTRFSSAGQMAELLDQLEMLGSLVASLGKAEDGFRESLRSVESSLAVAEATARLYSPPEIHSSNTLTFILSFERFAIGQARRASIDPEARAKRRARVTELAGGLLSSSVGASELAVSESPVPALQTVEKVTPRLWGPLNQHLGFVYRTELIVDVDSSFEASLPAQVCQVGSSIIALLTRINERLRAAGGEDAFRPTNRFVAAAVNVPTEVVVSDEGFGRIINALYFLLYEASGDGRRLVPLSSDSELAPLWRIKHLRLRYDHDIEHGSSSDVQSKYLKIGAAFQALIGGNLPARPSDWTRCQVQIYAQVYEMLSAIDLRLASGGEATIPATP